ncbi:MAG: hypothetical protein AB7S26_40285 [Sandaracinaceae bacterium]
MEFEALRYALDALDEPALCQGFVRLDRPLALQLPGGEPISAYGPALVEWLVPRSEPAPFGQGHETKLDPSVRCALRLTTRGNGRVIGLDLSTIIAEIEERLSPRTHLAATLTDVITYPVGGHFALHKDTPRSPALIGTLIVGLPVAHEGGAFRIENEVGPNVIDWSGPVDPLLLRWAALFTDVDHAVDSVTEGARVTLVYSLTQTEHVRDDQTQEQRLGALLEVARYLEAPDNGPLMIACTRQVIVQDGAPQPQGVATLRGTDRDVADVLTSCGFSVAVRTCVAARYRDGDVEPTPIHIPCLRGEGGAFFARLRRPLSDREVKELLEAVVFGPHAGGDGGGFMDDEASSLAPFIVDEVPLENWVFRTRALATFLREVHFSDYNFVGNDACEAFLYQLAALEVFAGKR